MISLNGHFDGYHDYIVRSNLVYIHTTRQYEQARITFLNNVYNDTLL